MGLDFSAASTAIYYSNSLNPEDRLQSEDRIVHPAKREPLLYIDLLTRGSVDEDIHLALQDKGAESKFFLSRVLRNFKERVNVGSGAPKVKH
jgi:SNF2 family DNA or RNA helicase